jgi:hypothetical protein
MPVTVETGKEEEEERMQQGTCPARTSNAMKCIIHDVLRNAKLLRMSPLCLEIVGRVASSLI